MQLDNKNKFININLLCSVLQEKYGNEVTEKVIDVLDMLNTEQWELKNGEIITARQEWEMPDGKKYPLECVYKAEWRFGGLRCLTYLEAVDEAKYLEATIKGEPYLREVDKYLQAVAKHLKDED